MDSGIYVFKSPESFFNELLEKAVKNQEIEISDPAKIYLVNLLSDNIDPENLLKKDESNPYAEISLAIVFQQSFLESIKKRRNMLRFVGDYSLYVAGYFSESLNRKSVDVDYYINMGGTAFNNLSAIVDSSNIQDLYLELFKKFSSLVDILTEISFYTCSTTANDIIKLYDRWLQTGSPVLEKKLMEKGIITSDKKLKIT